MHLHPKVLRNYKTPKLLWHKRKCCNVAFLKVYFLFYCYQADNDNKKSKGLNFLHEESMAKAVLVCIPGIT